MGLHLIAFSWTGGLMGWVWAVIALGVVIFVHELGHFLVAKAAGVKVEKFYLGFDIAGLKLFRFRYGETEYGIGILPLGGYVKMLGQEDNPAKLREEIERARLQENGNGHSPSAETAPAAATATAEPAQPTYDARSYLAKSVPARMAIISAGVIMNLIFAFLMGAVAYWIGVKQIACGVGDVVPGDAAWKANLRTGDDILAVNGENVARFIDVKTRVSLGDDLDKGVRLLIRRPGVPQPFTVTVFPIQRGVPSIGILSPRSTTLNSEGKPAFPGTRAAEAKPPLMSGDRIVEIDGRPIANPGDIEAAAVLNPNKPMSVTVERTLPDATQPERIKTTIAPQPMETLGMIMEMGEVTAVQADSPAAKAGLKAGDFIVKIDDREPRNPLRLLNGDYKAGDTITVTITRKGVPDPIDLDVVLRQADWLERPLLPGNPVSIPSMGVACRVLNRVRAVDDNSPASRAGIHPGDVVTSAALHPPEQLPPDLEAKQNVFKIAIGDEKRNWPFFFYQMQDGLPGSTVTLTLGDGRTVTMTPVAAKDWFNPDRGFILQPKMITERADSLGEAVRLGFTETLDATTMVFGVLGKLGTQISPRELSGPVGILQMASRAAQEGITRLLLFLTMLSANLAVINILPIPLLDGGHLVFLTYEGIRGRPASERVQLVLTYMGLVFLLALMVWVLGLDFHLISRE